MALWKVWTYHSSISFPFFPLIPFAFFMAALASPSRVFNSFFCRVETSTTSSSSSSSMVKGLSRNDNGMFSCCQNWIDIYCCSIDPTEVMVAVCRVLAESMENRGTQNDPRSIGRRILLVCQTVLLVCVCRMVEAETSMILEVSWMKLSSPFILSFPLF